MDRLGRLISYYRTDRGLTITEAARLAEISPAYWGQIESGDKWPSGEVWARIFRVLRLELRSIDHEGGSRRIL